MKRKAQTARQRNPAQIYNDKRRIVMSKMMTDPAKAREWLDGYKNDLGSRGHAGLNAELEFFDRYRRDYQLTPALDVGDATDFTGEIDGRLHRIDVTANIDFKKLSTYERFQAEGYRYRIAVWDGDDFELVDINFPFCKTCREGRILPTAALLGENHDGKGNSRYSNDQSLVSICSSCDEYTVLDTIVTPGLYDFAHWHKVLNEQNNDAKDAGEQPLDIANELRDYATAALRYLRQSFGQYLVGIGGNHYQVVNPANADGHWLYRLELILPLAKDHLQDSYQWKV